ncbi:MULTISPECIES: transposase [Aequorivita]|uniref:Transposase n=1 Tax=Aequorivita iocasae TaxID=2803865 RepID=A0ABX7DN78_9FLAO|nr:MULTISPECIES: transposase [Aequorivita]QQX75540.1 transposase [Aequorivita iocasae]UCA54994.1 transposase [Aequorivita sp. F7]
MAKFRGKYRIESIRAQWWNYGWNGTYFITIYTKNRNHYFGEITNRKMVFSSLGIIADILWHEIPNHSKFVSLGEFVVMPNHIHGILLIDKPDNPTDKGHAPGVDTGHAPGVVYTGHALYIPGKTLFQNIGKNTISSIVGSYKSAVTRHANRLEIENGWQAGFHDHIIRNHAEYNRIENYIIKNPQNWNDDKFNN